MLADYSILLISAILVNNFVLVQFLGLCPFMGVSNKLETAMGMSMATTFVLTLASACSNLTYHFLLLPLGLGYLKTIAFILVIAVVVQFTEMVVRKTSPLLHQVLGIFLPLITTNCAVLGVSLLNIQYNFTFVETIVFSAATSLGYSAVILIFSYIREQMNKAPIPEGFKGIPAGLIAASIMAFIFRGFIGLI